MSLQGEGKSINWRKINYTIDKLKIIYFLDPTNLCVIYTVLHCHLRNKKNFGKINLTLY